MSQRSISPEKDGYLGRRTLSQRHCGRTGEGSEKNPLYTADGQWSGAFTIKQGDSKRGKVVDSFKPTDIKLARLNVAPIEEQDPFESRRAWSKVGQSIEKGDMDAVSHFKSRIENAQRALRKKEQEGIVGGTECSFQADPKDKLEQTLTPWLRWLLIWASMVGRGFA